MKTILTSLSLIAVLVGGTAFAQDRTTVNAMSYDISDNLDLRAVASVFGDAQNLEDFERRLNDPKLQISNLDLNHDNQVDYLRVIESVEGNTHLVIIQSVLERDVYQDVATVEVERDRNNNVQVQVVGDVYMYGPNYIYEPVYVTTPVFYNYFWAPTYRPYYSGWGWNYYPSYYYAWNPYPVYSYQNNIIVNINTHNHYNYVNTRRSVRAAGLYSTRRSNGYERMYPQRSFAQRNTGVSNRHELVTQRAQTSTSRANGPATSRVTTSNSATRSEAAQAPIRSNAGQSSVRSTTEPATTRSETTGTRTTTAPTRSASSTRSQAPSYNTRTTAPASVRSTSSQTRSSSSTRTRNTSAPAQRTTQDQGFTGAGAQMRNGSSRQSNSVQPSQRSFQQPAGGNARSASPSRR